ncbi:cysteine--tRNA ligase [Mycoplasmopsis anatis]|uniref:Cysteine--tRNA ligase n=1 Tax=Mycoplasmopsis anatis 1340 TaxID=1034808 RepID=F9QE33_9BACT|nr:cysteine--tRNA ligase [Mycoplasmopsis anatis]AWX70351.1 cysteine--tRNA ligase [Mycoplasmopsis anatis]EGS28977.1 cysteine--tRNA ligase [Mycoplasmopsis anatis 1340]VEU74002.1 Cysteine--tRNA ligase [Mycoplasmopsis anatis]
MQKIYVCGPTVYNSVHIGNIRPILTFDIIIRAGKKIGQEFYFVHNITDIDDKIIKRAIDENVSETAISTKYATEYIELLKKFNIISVDKFEYVTENLDLINEYIEKLVNSKNAYLDKYNNVYFDVEKNKIHYGNVSNQNIEKMQFEDENNINNKNNPADFALWKKTNIGVKYPSKFGEGRPGWHTECCVLIYKHFGSEGVDIHGGGIELVFPHHENENIQHYSMFDKNLAKKWIRTGMLKINGEKMSKSLNNFILASEFLDKYNPDIYRMMILNTQISGDLDFNDETIYNSKVLLNKFRKILFSYLLINNVEVDVNTELLNNILNEVYNNNFAIATRKINELIKNINKNNSSNDVITLIEIFNSLGFNTTIENLEFYKKTYFSWKEKLAQKNYAEADKLREILYTSELI